MVWGAVCGGREWGSWERGWGWVKGQRRGDGMGQEGGGGRGEKEALHLLKLLKNLSGGN